MSFGWATVETVDPLSVRRDGESEPLGVEPGALVTKAYIKQGRRVWCQFHARRALILGVSGGAPRMANGDLLVEIPTAGEVVSKSITFPVGRFTDVPNVVAAISTSIPDVGSVSAKRADTTKDGFILYVVRKTTTDTGVSWQAQEKENGT